MPWWFHTFMLLMLASILGGFIALAVIHEPSQRCVLRATNCINGTCQIVCIQEDVK